MQIIALEDINFLYQLMQIFNNKTSVSLIGVIF